MLKPALALRLHRQLGIWLGLFLLLMGLSGALLVFRPELSRLLYPSVFASHDCEPRGRLSTAVQAAAERAPDLAILYVEDMQTACVNAFAIAVPLDPNATSDPVMLGLDLTTGDTAGRMALSDNLLNFVLTMHTTVFAGRPVGRRIVGALGIAMTIVTITGVLVWARGQSHRLGAHLQRTYQVRWNFLAYDTHRATGIGLALLILLVTVTGISMAFEQDLQSLASRLALAPLRPMPATLLAQRDDVTAGSLAIPETLALAERLLPHSRPAAAGFEGPNGELAYVRGRRPGDNFRFGRDMIFFDRQDGRPLAIIDSRTDPGSWFIALDGAWTLHTGAMLGVGGRSLALVTGVAVIALALFGARIWYNRRRRERRSPKPA